MTIHDSLDAAWPARPDGAFFRPLLPGRWQVPIDVTLVDGCLLWSWPTHDVSPDSTLLPRFAALANATDDQVLAFAQRWGVLEICGHGRPSSHSEADRQPDLCFPRPVDEQLTTFSEPVDAWRALAREVRGIVKVAAALHAGRRATVADWADIAGATIAAQVEHLVETGGDADRGPARLGQEVNFDRRVLTGVVEMWLREGAVRPHVQWGKRTPGVELAGWGLFGALAVQLLQVVSRIDGLITCSGCGKAYLPKRRPNPNRDHYCPDCGVKAAWRKASRRYRRHGE
jgi:hypothetical protein